jgi:hypothetical protein
MTTDRKSGVLLIAGSLAGIFTMAIHPVAGGALTTAQADHLALVSAVAHSIAILSFLPMFLGACGLTRRLAARDRKPEPDHLAFAALVAFGFACVAILIAASISGYIVPSILRHMVRDDPATVPQYRLIAASVFQFNQAFARIFSVGSSIAIALWSASALRNGGIGRVISLYGCVVAALVTLGIVAGHLRLDVHGMAAVVLGQAIWFVVVGAQLWRGQGPAAPAVTSL